MSHGGAERTLSDGKHVLVQHAHLAVEPHQHRPKCVAETMARDTQPATGTQLPLNGI